MALSSKNYMCKARYHWTYYHFTTSVFLIMKHLNLAKILFFIVIFALQSCGDKSQKSTEIDDSDLMDVNAIPNEFESALRPNQKLELGKIYTDTVKFVDYNDEGDNGLFIVEKSQDSIYLIHMETFDFVRGDELEVQWKIDSIRYAGDSDFLDFREQLVSAKKIKSLKLEDKNIKVLWRETKYNTDLDTDINSIVLNDHYIRSISEPEKAVLTYIATFIGNECEWDGHASETRSNLKCKILNALDLGYQCSPYHLDFLRKWFRNNKVILKELENCPTTPDGATIQDTFDEINLEIKGNQITIFFKASGINMREASSWNWTEKQHFEFKENELILIGKEVSEVEHSTFEVRGN